MSEKSRVILIFGAVAVALTGGLYYFFKIHQPKQLQGKAQEEVLAWEERFDAARTCLLGKAPISSQAGEALAGREMQPDPWERKTCTKLIGKLSRGVAEDTGLMKVEHAWMTIDRVAGKFANAFAMHADPFGDATIKANKDNALSAALAGLDTAHAELRQAAGMEPPVSATLPPLPVADLIVLKDGEHPVKSLDAWVAPSAGGMFAHGSTQGGQVQIVVTAGQAPKIMRVPNGALRAVPDLSWGATSLFAEIVIAPIDDKGAFGDSTKLKLPDDAGGRVLVAAGTYAAGMIVYTTGDALMVARSAGGPFAADKPIETGRSTTAIDPAGRVLVAWNGPYGDDADTAETARLRGFISKGDAAPKELELGTGYAGSSCLTTKFGWVGDSAQVIHFDDSTAVPHVLPQHALIGCTRDTALLYRSNTAHFVACTESCRVIDIAGMKPTHIATVAGGKVHAFHARGGVLGVWRESQSPAFYNTGGTFTPIMATSDDKVIDVLGTTEGGVAIVRIPVK